MNRKVHQCWQPRLAVFSGSNDGVAVRAQLSSDQALQHCGQFRPHQKYASPIQPREFLKRVARFDWSVRGTWWTKKPHYLRRSRLRITYRSTPLPSKSRTVRSTRPGSILLIASIACASSLHPQLAGNPDVVLVLPGVAGLGKLAKTRILDCVYTVDAFRRRGQGDQFN